MTVLMTTHYMDEADAYCDRISLMTAARPRSWAPRNLAALGDDRDRISLMHRGKIR